MSDEDLDLFRSTMGDVQPIKAGARVRLLPGTRDQQVLRARREAAQAFDATVGGPFSVDYVEPVEPLAVLSFMRSGVQHSVFKKLRQGQYPLDVSIDLHSMNVEQARTAILEFIRDCLAHGIRFALITHGKGEGREQPAVLKSCINTWLPQVDDVLAYHSAQKRHGGVGATYVMLRLRKEAR